MNVPLTDILIVSYRENEINPDEVLNLKAQVDEKKTELSAVDNELKATQNSSSAKDSIIGISEQQIQISRKEKRREKWIAAGDWIKDKWKELTGGTVLFGIGVGVGYALK